MQNNITTDLQHLHDAVMMNRPVLHVADEMVNFIKQYVNPEAAYTYLMLDFGNYHQLLAGYSRHLIHFYRDDFTPMENDHRWNDALKLIEDQPKNYYTINGDFLKPIDNADLQHSFQTLIENLTRLTIIQPGQRDYFSLIHQPKTKFDPVTFDMDMALAPQLYQGYFKNA